MGLRDGITASRGGVLTLMKDGGFAFSEVMKLSLYEYGKWFQALKSYLGR